MANEPRQLTRMDPRAAELIQHDLQAVEAERHARDRDPLLASRVLALKRYQQARFRHSYADLLATPRYAAAAGFFLEELYGPADFRSRDAQFARIVPALVRLFPAEVVDTVRQLAALHALSERLDTQLARALAVPAIDAPAYAQAWRQCGDAPGRQAQIDLTVAVGTALDALTRKPLLRQSLRMMRGPAQLAGLADLQHFLECGFDTFKAMRGAAEFLSTVRVREEALVQALFDPASTAATAPPLGQLP
jgi:hypothetical protein